MSGEHFSMDTIHHSRTEFHLGESASGTIDPTERSLNAELLTKLERDILSSRFDVTVPSDISLPCGCIDGRCPAKDDAFNALPNAAGGTLSLMVGELLTDKANIASTALTTEEALASLIGHLKTIGKADQIGGHTGPAHGPNADQVSGCGANDALYDIIGQIVDKKDTIEHVLMTLGIDASSFNTIVNHATEMRANPDYFVSGRKVADTLFAESPDGNCPQLIGAHNEVLIRLNNIPGTTIDRRALAGIYGDDFQIFNVDVWALQEAAQSLSATKVEAANKFAAMVTYQVATALQLCGPGMRVLVR